MLRRLAIAALGLLTAVLANAQAVPTVAAASDLKFVLDEVAAAYQRTTGRAVRITYGSSGNFVRQIEQNAPFDMFMSADEAYIDTLAAKGLTLDGGSLYAVGRVVLFAARPETFAPDERMEGLRKALAQGTIKRFAIANPEHAPYGRAAKEALQSASLWQVVEPKLVLGENVSQAAQFAASGDTAGGIFALSLVLAPNFGDKGRYVVLPESMHKPLRQKMVLLKRGPPETKAFYDYLQQPQAREVFKRYGFALPGE